MRFKYYVKILAHKHVESTKQDDGLFGSYFDLIFVFNSYDRDLCESRMEGRTAFNRQSPDTKATHQYRLLGKIRAKEKAECQKRGAAFSETHSFSTERPFPVLPFHTRAICITVSC
jgi:hypothetical protein